MDFQNQSNKHCWYNPRGLRLNMTGWDYGNLASYKLLGVSNRLPLTALAIVASSINFAFPQ